MMADNMWDRVKDFAYRHAPEAVRERIDDNRAIARLEAEWNSDFGPDIQRKRALDNAIDEHAPQYAEPVIRADQHLRALNDAARAGIADSREQPIQSLFPHRFSGVTAGRAEGAWVTQEQRDAARASAPTPEHAGQMASREVVKTNDRGLER